MIMKCLSVSQPFANMIISGQKTIELRRWNTSFRGELLIHAPKKIRVKDCKRLRITSNMVTGAIVGKVEIYDVKTYTSKAEIIQDKRFHYASREYYNGKTFGFLLKNPKMLRIPIPWKGQLGLFDVDMPKINIKKNQIVAEIIDEETRYQWIGHH